MPQIIVLKPFKFAHRGVEVEEFEPHPKREPRDTTQELVDHDGLVDEGYIEIVGEAPAPAPAPQQLPAAPAAPATASSPTPAPVEPPAPAPAPAPVARKTPAKKAGK